MPRVGFPALLSAVYSATSSRLQAGNAPTNLITRHSGLLRAIDPKYAALLPDGSLSSSAAGAAIQIRNATRDDMRFSGTAGPAGTIGPKGALYTSELSAAMANEVLHYSAGQVPTKLRTGMPIFEDAISLKCVLQLRVYSSLLVADLEPYSAETAAFLRDLQSDKGVRKALDATPYKGASLESLVHHGGDCSAARGIGLAVGHSPFLAGLRAGTARDSDRSPEETGSNVVLMGDDGTQVGGVEIEKAFTFSRDAMTGELLIVEHPLEGSGKASSMR